MKALGILTNDNIFDERYISENEYYKKEIEYYKKEIEEAIKELEERQKEDEYIYQNMKESLSMGNKAQSLSFVEVYQIINKRLNK